MTIQEKVKNLPFSPGVYLMKDSLGNIIYVGKSKKLKSRVSTYFQQSRKPSRKVEALVSNIKDFDYIETDTEFEALLLECELIKKLQPRYNRMMKNSKAYHYITIDMDQDFPSIEIVINPVEKNNTFYFGPYPNKYALEDAILEVKDYLGINCKNLSKRASPCFNYALGKCEGVCTGEISRDHYKDLISKITSLLSGKDSNLIKEITQRMNDAAMDFDFETAAKLRDTLNHIEALVQKERVMEFAKENKKIVMIERLTENMYKIFYIQGNHILSSRVINPNTDLETLSLTIKSDIQHEYQQTSTSKNLNKEEIDGAHIIYNFITKSTNPSLILCDNWQSDDYQRQFDNQIKVLLETVQLKYS